MSYIWSKLRFSFGSYRRGPLTSLIAHFLALGCGFSWAQR
jgi:hypothetical protein